MKPNLICIGTSAGGVTALQELFIGLRKEFKIPIVVVQHLPADANINPDLVFGRYFLGSCLEAQDKISLRPGTLVFAPPNYHLLIERDMTLSLSQDEPVCFARPSIDVLFESAAYAFGESICGVLLTGANNDGALGLKSIHECGGITIVQDPETAEAPAMPLAALKLFKPKCVLSLSEIAMHLNRLDEGD